ncbi:nucleotidyltransferase [Lysinibacillus sp. 54212]|uniref:nucleotidyltransferase n=1 Tax=Lysinibacillus sp. 54212 TaxID=3119829 RepID=UPI002FC6D9EB
MQAVGLVVEYNPFHNGHLHHVLEAKCATQSDVAIAVMSGQFLQRGEPALVDKWTRTKMALENGVDLVIELPYVYSTAPANDFARGAISLLSSIGCSNFAFGSEEGRILPFLNAFTLIDTHRTSYNELIKSAIATGVSYPQALQFAYTSLQEQYPDDYIDLAKPNNILGFHYIEAAHHIDSDIQPITIQRIGAGYHDEIRSTSEIASATGIRKALFSDQPINSFMPQGSLEQLNAWHHKHGQFVHWEKFWPLLQFAILRHAPNELTAYPDVQEGIENALWKHAQTSKSYTEFMTLLKSKRYTWTRLQRILTHIFTGVTKDRLHSFQEPSYIRLLGMTKNGQSYLSLNKKSFRLPLISRVAAVKDDMLALDIHATTMYGLGVQSFSRQKIDGDFQTPPIRI